MNKKRITAIVTLVLLAAVGGYQVKAHAQPEFPKPCRVLVPAEWGAYKGMSRGTGLIFEDKTGTLRIISDIPCDTDSGPVSSPRVLVELYRK